jgi:hypothetical protein
MADGFLLRSLSFTTSDFIAMQAGTSGAYTGNDFMGMVARTDAAGVSWQVRFDLGAALPVDTIAALNSLFADGAAWYVTAGNDPSFATYGYQQFYTAGAELPNSAGRRHLLHMGPTQSYRYWLITIESAPGLRVEVARVLFGVRSAYGRNFSFGAQRGAEDLGEIDHSSRGATLRRRGRKLRTLGLGWQMLSQAEAEGFTLPLLEEAGNTDFVLACLNPDPDPQRSRRIYYGNLTGDLSLTWRNHNMWEKRLQMQSVI